MSKITTSAATFSGNQGAAGMLHATIQNLPGNEFVVFSVYPEADQRINHYENVTVVSATPKRLVAVLIPSAFAYRFIPPLRSLLRTKVSGIAELASADLQIDLAGISFADNRRKFLLYNVASVLPAVLLKLRIVKFSQAMGEFNDSVNRFVARRFLPKFEMIFARGATTRKSLDTLDLTNVRDASDIAFLFKPSADDEEIAKEFLKSHDLGKDDFIVFSPSSVLYKKARAADIDYISETAEVIDKLIKELGLPIVVLPHAVRDDPEKLHNNDIVIVEQIYHAVKSKKQCFIASEPLYAGSIKTIIGEAKLVVAARFHAMIGALSMGTPVVVTGWSHKYQEVLDLFEVELPVVYLDEHYQAETIAVTKQAFQDSVSLKKRIQSRQKSIKQKSMKQIEYIKDNFLKN